MINNILMMAQGDGKGGEIGNLVFILLIFVVFYFFMIRPQMKKAKDQKKYIEGLKKGDKVVTIGGIHGKIIDSNETTFVIEVEDGGKLRVQRNAVSMDSTASLASQNK